MKYHKIINVGILYGHGSGYIARCSCFESFEGKTWEEAKEKAQKHCDDNTTKT